MDIDLFIKSLTESEKDALRNYLMTNVEAETTRQFIGKNEMSSKLRNILYDNSASRDVFHYVSEINKHQFLKIRRAGVVAWKELQFILKKKI